MTHLKEHGPTGADLYVSLAVSPDPDDAESRPEETITLTEEHVDPLSAFEALMVSSLMDA